MLKETHSKSQSSITQALQESTVTDGVNTKNSSNPHLGQQMIQPGCQELNLHTSTTTQLKTHSTSINMQSNQKTDGRLNNISQSTSHSSNQPIVSTSSSTVSIQPGSRQSRGRRAVLSDDEVCSPVKKSSNTIQSVKGSTPTMKPDVTKSKIAVSSSGSESDSSSSGSDSSSSSDSESSSSDDSSSDSESDSSSKEESDDSTKHVMIGGKKIKVQPKLKAKSKAKARVKRNSPNSTSPSPKRLKKQESSADEEEDEDDEVIGGHVVKSRIGSRGDTEKLIARILCRWWYVLPPWPPADFDWDAALKERKLKVISVDQWESADDVDENGFTKVYPISHFEGIYRDPQGTAIDLRPLEGKPCYSVMKSKSAVELHEMLVAALKNQMAELPKSPYKLTERETVGRMRKNLGLELSIAEDSLGKLRKRKSNLEPKKELTKYEVEDMLA